LDDNLVLSTFSWAYTVNVEYTHSWIYFENWNVLWRNWRHNTCFC